MKIISNHRFFNFTGQELIINATKNYRTLAIKLNPDDYKDLELISDFNYESESDFLNKNMNNFNNKIIAADQNSNFNKDSIEVNFFLCEKKYEGSTYQDNTLSIDKNGIKQHYIYYHTIDRPLNKNLESYQYIVSEITCSRLKRHIYLYSPLVFHNKTRRSLILEFINKGYNYNESEENSNYIVIVQGYSKVGIPIQYLDCIILVSTGGSSYYEPESLNYISNQSNQNGKTNNNLIDAYEIMTKNYFFKEIKVNNLIINFHRKQNKNINFLREIKINNAYSVKNYLPFDITIHSKYLDKPVTLQKSEKASIDGLSFSKAFELLLQIGEYATRDSIMIPPFNDFDFVNKMHTESNKLELDNYRNLIKQRFAQNQNSNLPNNLKTIKLYHRNFSQNNLTLEVSGLIYFKYTNFHIELAFLSTNIIVNETGLENMRLFYSTKKEIGMPINYIKQNYKNTNKAECELINNINEKSIYRIFNNSENRFFININECESNVIHVNDDLKPSQPIISVCKGKHKQYDFVISVEYSYVTNDMRKTDNQIDLLCRVITIKPRIIIINELEMFSLNLCLEREINKKTGLVPQEAKKQRFTPRTKNSFYFFNDPNSLSNPLCVKVEPFIFNEKKQCSETPINEMNYYDDNFQIVEDDYSTGLIYDWSRPISLCYQGLFTIPVTYEYLDFNHNNSENIMNNNELYHNQGVFRDVDLTPKKKKKFYLNIDIKYVNLNMIVSFSEATFENTQFLIENNLNNICVRIFQYKYEGINDEMIQPANYSCETINEYEKVYEDGNKKQNKSIFSLINYLSNSNSTGNCLGIEFYKYENNSKTIHEFNKRNLESSNINNFSNTDYIEYVDFSNCILTKMNNSIYYYSIFENKIQNHSNGKTYEYPIIDEVTIKGERILIFIETKGMKKTITFENKNKEYSRTLSNTMLNTSITLQIELNIKNIGISIISDNIYHDRKHRNYSRNEILFVLLSEISLFFKKDSKLGNNYDEGELRLSLGDLKVDNVVSPHNRCRFPNFVSIVDDNKNEEAFRSPFFDLSVFSQIHVFDKISKITYLNYYIKTIKIAFDTDLIEEIIFFANNITYRLKSSFIDIHKIFKDEIPINDSSESKKKFYNKNSNFN